MVYKKHNSLFFIIATILICLHFNSDAFRIHNTTKKTIYATVFLLPKNHTIAAQRKTDVISIEAGQTGRLKRPNIPLLQITSHERILVFSDTSNIITEEELNNSFIRNLPHTSISKLRGKHFYISEHKSILQGYSFFEWYLMRPIEMSLANLTYLATHKVEDALQISWQAVNPHAKKTISVRTEKTLCPAEKEFIEKRKPRILQALARHCNHTSYTSIGIAFSGGGQRARNYTAGFFYALQKTGILNIFSYMSFLSGSTWFAAPFLESKKTLDDFLRTPINNNAYIDIKTNIPLANSRLLRKKIFKQPLSFIDIYGMGLESQHIIPVSQDTLYLETKNDEYPYPIYTACIADTNPYTWMEFTPDEIGSEDIGGFIPSFAFNSQFFKGKSHVIAPCESLGFLLGIWGSAISVNIRETAQALLEGTIQEKLTHSALVTLLSNTNIGHSRAAIAEVHNFAFGIQGSPLAHKQTCKLLDAGIDFNTPIPPLLRQERNCKIIVVVDISGTIEGAPEFKKAIEYAKKHGLTMPDIDFNKAGKNACSVYYDPNNTATPCMIYIPRINLNTAMDKGHASTFNLTYSKEEAEFVFQMGYEAALAAIPTIKTVIQNYPLKGS